MLLLYIRTHVTDGDSCTKTNDMLVNNFTCVIIYLEEFVL